MKVESNPCMKYKIITLICITLIFSACENCENIVDSNALVPATVNRNKEENFARENP